MDELLKENERIDDLEVNGFRIIQNPFYFCFGMDAVLLANFAKIKDSARVIDLGTGTGIIPLLLAAKGKGKSWVGLEIQPEMVDLARRSLVLNGVSDEDYHENVAPHNIETSATMDEDTSITMNENNTAPKIIKTPVPEGRCRIVQGDICRIREIFEPAVFEAVTSNPPYMRENAGLKNPSDTKYISRHEALLCLEDVIAGAAYLLKTRGTFSMVHRPSRLPEIMELLCKYRLEPKRMQLVQPSAGKEPNMVLIEAVKEGGRELRMLPALNVYGDDGKYTEELLRYYRGEY